VEDACVGPLLWRITAASVISTLLACLHQAPVLSSPNSVGLRSPTPSTDMSPIYAGCLQILTSKNYLAHIVSAGIGPLTNADSTQSDKFTGDRGNGLLSSTLLVCTEIAMCSPGIHALVQSNIFANLLTLEHLLAPVSIPQVYNQNAPSSVNTLENEELGLALDLQQLQLEHLQQVLQFMSVCLCTSQQSVDVVRGCLMFIKQMRQTIVYYLKKSAISVNELSLKKSIVTVLSLCSSAPSSFEERGKQLSFSLFDQILEHLSDTLTADICSIVGEIGEFYSV
jgi:hypothetical protein